MTRLNLASCTLEQLSNLKKSLHPARDRRELIFAAGALNNKTLQAELGSNELATFYDGKVAAGHLSENPYWPDVARKFIVSGS